MKSIIDRYYNRRSLRLDNDKSIKEMLTSNNTSKANDSISPETSQAKQEIHDDTVVLKNEANSNDEGLAFDLNIKFIDDADTDASSNQSDAEESNRRIECAPSRKQLKMQENIFKELEKLNKNLEAIYTKSQSSLTNNANQLFKKTSVNTTSSNKKTDETATITNDQEKNLLLNDLKICLNQIKNNFSFNLMNSSEFNKDIPKLNENKLQIEEPNMNSNFNLNRNSKFFSNESLVNNNRKSYETLAIENKVLQEKLLQMEEKLKQEDDEIVRLKEAFEMMRIDRKRLKCERLDLLSQTRDLYKSLEVKENEIRDFLKYYEKKTNETSMTVQKLIDSKTEMEHEINDLHLQLASLSEENNENKLVIESKCACIKKLQQDIFELKSKSVRNSLCKDFGYSSSKSSNTLSTSLIETPSNDINNSTLATINTSVSSNNEFKMTTITPNKLSNLKQRVKKEDRHIKCKSNDSFIYIKNSTYSTNSIRSKSTMNNSKLKYKFKSVNNTSNITSSKSKNNDKCGDATAIKLNNTTEKKTAKSSNNLDLNLKLNTNLDYDSDLNKVLDSDAFIDLDDLDCTKNNETNLSSQMNNTSLDQSKLNNFAENSILECKTTTSPQTTLEHIKEFTSESSASSSSAQLNIPNALSISPSVSLDSTSSLYKQEFKKQGNSNTSSLNKQVTSSSSSTSSPMVMNQSITVIEDETSSTNPATAVSSIVRRVKDSNNSSNKISRSSRLFNTIIRMSTIGVSSTSASSSSSCSPITTNLTSSMVNKSFAEPKNSINSENRKSLSNKLFKSFNSNQNASIKQEKVSVDSDSCGDQDQDQDADSFEALDIDLNDFTANVEKWTPSMVRIWLEKIGMMPTHVKSAVKFIKNGKSLLNMSDNDLEKAFALNNNLLHKRKLRLAIDELKFPEKCKYPKLSEITTSWLTNVWLKQIGLSQFQNLFKANLIDGRVLASLQRKDLEKYLSISKRNLQTSILLAIELLRKFEFDIDNIETIRKNSNNTKQLELSLWINENFIEWLKLVNLQNFSANLSESGIHGALVIDSAFNVDILYMCLGVNSEETRYHNMKKILEDEIKLLKKTNGITKPAFSRTLTSIKHEKRMFNLRGSLGRALGKKIKRDISSPLIDDDTYKRIEFSHNLVDTKKI